MDRMGTFFKYALWIVLFFIFSTVVTNVLLSNSYHDLSKGNNISIAESEDGLKVETTEANSNNVQGYYKGKITNTSDKAIPQKYVRIKSYSAGGSELQTKYIKLEDMQPGETREFNARFDVGGIDRYEVDYVDEMPDNSTFADDMFDRVKNFIKAENKLDAFDDNFSHWGFSFKPLKADIPEWAWWAAGLIVLSSLPF